MKEDLRKKLLIDPSRLEKINQFLLKEPNPLVDKILEIIEKYGGVEKINKSAEKARSLDEQLKRLEELKSPYIEDLEWLIKKRDEGAFIPIPDYRRKILGEKADSMEFNDEYAVTLEISALQFFPWLIAEAKRAIEKEEVMPARYIRVRRMKEQVEDNDIIAVGAAMNIIGASYVECLDTKGTDGSNIHLGGPETITGYFGGIGEPNDYPLKWVDEYLYYYTNYGVKQVLNINAGTILLGYILYKLGIDIEFKISVYMGIDNPYSVLWTLMVAYLFSRDDGSTSLRGLNFSNSVNNNTIEISAIIRKDFGFEELVRFEHHVLETTKNIVIQPYDRRKELIELAKKVKNLSAKHEGGEIEREKQREHPTDILDYFLSKEEIISRNLMDKLLINYLDKHEAVNNTARLLTENGLSFIAAWNLHKGSIRPKY
ncbi:MAG: hypothetical protein DRP67_00480 [Candidatus Omnitrophota bacterium]|nr:MAG: hypothetical protein DRP67_00480 [Candidatus Omnitrophota bacterium]HDN97972.1 hypothetical protein [bacterium]